jgi:8-oxo-dGTP pyrophosphatase MutT (NUDIX family)
MTSHVRYQGAVMRGSRLLLIQQREQASGRAYWLLPGGGREPGESEEACVARELWEETGLHVHVERLLLDAFIDIQGYGRQRFKTYLCHADGGEPQPGYEPEEVAAQNYAIVEVGWFDLASPETWGGLVRTDRITFPQLQKIQAELGYPVAGG